MTRQDEMARKGQQKDSACPRNICAAENWTDEGIPSCNENDLCTYCAALDLNKAIASKNSIPTNSGTSKLLLNPKISGWHDLQLDCPLCRFFSRHRARFLEPDHNHSQTTFRLIRLKIEDAFHVESNRGFWNFWKKLRRGSAMLFVVPRDHQWNYHLSGSNFQWLPYAILDCNLDDIHGRVVPRGRINFSLLNDWLDWCDCNHVRCRSEASTIKTLQVIDVSERKLVALPAADDYVAVSWVWAGYEPLPLVGGKLPLLPRTLEDALCVVTLLGMRYVWIDAYCIDQKDALNKAKLIGQMDDIYSQAAVTLIAACGQNSSYGLVGVSSSRMLSRPDYLAVNDLLLTSGIETPADLVAASKWGTRGWTFQEGLLSRRRLIFTEQEVLFQCRSMCCMESIHWPLRLVEDWQSFVRSGEGNYKRHDQAREKWILSKLNVFDSATRTVWQLISEFLSRSLTRETDIIDGVKGVLNAKLDGRHIWGLPVEHARGANIMLGVVRSLFWSSNVALTRRKNFPSWSWAGWSGWDRFKHPGVWQTYPELEGYWSLFTGIREELQTMGTVHLVTGTGPCLPSNDESVKEFLGKRQFVPYLHFEGLAIALNLEQEGPVKVANFRDNCSFHLGSIGSHLNPRKLLALPLIEHMQTLEDTEETWKIMMLVVAKRLHRPSDCPSSIAEVYERIGLVDVEDDRGFNYWSEYLNTRWVQIYIA